MSIADTSNILLKEGIMPYDISSYLLDKPSTSLGNKDYYPDYSSDKFIKSKADSKPDSKKKKSFGKPLKYLLLSAAILIPTTYLVIKNKAAIGKIFKHKP